MIATMAFVTGVGRDADGRSNSAPTGPVLPGPNLGGRTGVSSFGGRYVCLLSSALALSSNKYCTNKPTSTYLELHGNYLDMLREMIAAATSS